MIIKMYAKNNSEFIVTGVENQDIWDFMMETGLYVKNNFYGNEYTIKCCDSEIEAAKKHLIDIILRNHDVESLEEEIICSHIVYIIECYE